MHKKGEGSAQDLREDKILAKKHGMTLEQWEKSAADKAHDAPNNPPSTASHNFPTARNAQSFGHGVDRRQGHLRMSGHPGAHRIGCKK